MFIRAVNDSLERLLRDRLPLPDELGDVAFDPPSGTWSAQLSRITVSLFLYDVRRSAQPSRSPVQRHGGENGMRRKPQPMIELCYLLSAWAGSPRDEHQLLGDVVSILAGVDRLPTEYVVGEPASSIHLALDSDSRSHTREIWSASGGSLKASVTLQATVAADAFGWEQAPPAVERIEALAHPGVPATGRS